MRHSLKRDLLIMLASVGDTVIESMPRHIYRQAWWPGYKRTTLAQTVWQLTKINAITREVDNKGNTILRLGSQGGKLLDETLPLYKLQRKPWDKKWRLLIFDIAEEFKVFRDGLRNKLKELGFAMWQKSVYVSPHNVTTILIEYLEAQNLDTQAACLETQKVWPNNNTQFAAEVFKLEEIREEYEEIILEAKELIEQKSNRITHKQAQHKRRMLWEKYLQVLDKDPFLPKELLPANWPHRKTRLLLQQLNRYSINENHSDRGL